MKKGMKVLMKAVMKIEMIAKSNKHCYEKKVLYELLMKN